ncbi:tetratricopeptide repeat protein [Massilia sp. W12]|uniref:tetratricopeptide repeat protein n=1 Tax=Massilia sp. W12 TaxID=3126507 RepID=UPI0030CD8E69
MSHQFAKPGPEAANAKLPDWKNQHYLLVDDFQGMRQLLRESLRNLGARFVDQAGSGGEAIMMLQQTRYNVVLCDYNLGQGKNGQQVLEEAKLRELVRPTVVWIVVSAEKSVESVMGAAELQPDAYLIKPITEEVLLTRLNRAWHRKQVFRPIDQAYLEKDYLRAAKLCDVKGDATRVHALDLLRMKAMLLIKSGEYEQAREVYERVLGVRDFIWARAGLAKIKMKNGEFHVARDMFREIINENRYFIDAYDQLAATYQQMGQFDDAAKILEAAAKLSPNSVQRQRSLGELAMKVGNTAQAERAFRKCLSMSEFSIYKSPDAQLGLARVCGQKSDTKEALALLTAVQKEYHTEQVKLRAKITEGLVYHESGDYIKARRAGDELGEMLATTTDRPAPPICLDMARLMFAVGVKEPPVILLSEIIRNNHDNDLMLQEVQEIFEKARMGEEGASIIAASRKEASDLMNRGVLLWKTGKLPEAVEWMRNARQQLPTNLRVLFNCAQIMISYMQKHGFEASLAEEARDVLLQVDRLQPGQQRFAQLMEMLADLTMRSQGRPAQDEDES